MKLNAIGVVSSNMRETTKFYSLLGFTFPEFKDEDPHVEALETSPIRLMIDKKELITDIMGEEPVPANHSAFAVEYDSSEEIDKVIEKLKDKNYTIVKEPWDAFWGQRYAIVKDPDGYLVDLYAQLN